MNEMKKDIKEIKDHIYEIKGDLRYHIKRTDLLEAEVMPISKFVSFIKWLAFSLAAASTLLGIGAAIKKAYGSEVRPIEGILAQIQTEVPCKIKVHSHWRSKAHNEKVGGVKNSMHLDGRAMDISAPCLNHRQLGAIANKYTTVIIYRTHVHIDERPGTLCFNKLKGKFIPCKEKI